MLSLATKQATFCIFETLKVYFLFAVLLCSGPEGLCLSQPCQGSSQGSALTICTGRASSSPRAGRVLQSKNQEIKPR